MANSAPRHHSPTAYTVRLPNPNQEAIHKLVDVCREAVLEYDKSNDHCRHDKGADCIRCNLAAVLWASGAPDPSFHKTALLRETARRRLHEAIELFPEVASGVRSFDEDALASAEAYILQTFPGMTVTTARAAEAVRRAVATAREIERVRGSCSEEEFDRLRDVLSSQVGDAESCAHIMHQAH